MDEQIDIESLLLSARTIQGLSDDLVRKIIAEGESTKEALGMDPQLLEGLYNEAYRLYQSGKYMEALPFFRLLVLTEGREFRFLFGLAACFHLLKEYSLAAQAYTACSLLQPEDPIPHYHAADCLLKTEHQELAMVALQLAIDKSASRAEYRHLKERAALTLDQIRNAVAAS